MKINLVKNGIFPIVYDKEGKLINEDLDTGFKIPGTVQGEGRLMGSPCLFIRTSGCNLRCWVDNGEKKYSPIIIPTKGKTKKLKETKVGEKILAIDEKTGNLVETTIVGYREDTTNEYYKIDIEKIGEIYVTAEHPFLTTKGWVDTENLKVGDVLEEISSTQIRKTKFGLYPSKAGIEGRKRISERMKNNNPIHLKGVKEKIYSNENYIGSRKSSGEKSAKFRKENGINWKTYISEERIEELCKQNSERMKLNNPMFNHETVIKVFKTREQNKNKLSRNEIKMLELISELGLENEIWFSGHGDYHIYNNGKVRIPDFKIHGKKKLIEVTEPYYFRPDFEKYKIETDDFYKEVGYEVLTLNMQNDREELKKEILHYFRNGYKINSIKKIKKEAKTFNIQCEPYNNYVIKKNNKYIINHNCVWMNEKGGSPCDTSYSSHNPESNKMEIEDIVSVLKHNLGENIKHLVISGGEPFQQTKALRELLKAIKNEFEFIHITVETNGTIYDEECAENIDLFSISPKLSNSDPTKDKYVGEEMTGINYTEVWEKKHKEARINYESLQKFIDHCSLTGKDFQLKFVVSNEQDLSEIKEIESNLELINSSDIMLMPEGYYAEDIMNRSVWLTQKCVENGYFFTTRLHTLMFGTKRGV